MPSTSTSLDVNLNDLLYDVSSGKMQIPEFQRDWTWDDIRIRGIIASLSLGYPIGVIMRLQYGNDNMRFKYRTLVGVEPNNVKPEYLLLDGQQRLTSIFQSIYSCNYVVTKNENKKKIEKFYYLDIQECFSDNIDRIDSVISVPKDKIIRKKFSRENILDLSNTEKEYEQKMFPVNIIFDNSKLLDWYVGYNEFYRNSTRDIELFKRFMDEIIKTIQSYKLPVITLNKETPKEAVCKIFENVNTGGVSLTVFDLVTAAFAADDFDLREDWTKCEQSITGKDDFIYTDLLSSIDETMFLTTVTLYTNYMNKLSGKSRIVSCKKGDILQLDYKSYLQNRDKVISGYILAKEFLYKYQSISREKDLPYRMQLIPLSAICAFIGKKMIHDPNVLQILTRWYWCGIFGEMYGASTEERFAKDMEDIIDEIDGKIRISRTVNSAFFSATRLLTLQTRQSAAYKGIISLLYKERCEDFIHGTTVDNIKNMQAPDIHHIFPEKYCNKIGIPKKQYNCIINKTLLFPETNRSIGGSAPSIYIKRILESVKGITEETLKSRIESHAINYDYLVRDNFREYFIDRAKRLLYLIEKSMGKPITDKDTEDTKREYEGSSLL